MTERRKLAKLDLGSISVDCYMIAADSYKGCNEFIEALNKAEAEGEAIREGKVFIDNTSLVYFFFTI